jgi:hypothetical protein
MFGMMKMVCAWCREAEKSEALKTNAKRSGRQESYTICPKCVDTFFPGLLPNGVLDTPTLHVR